MQKISTFLWFRGQAEEAARFYVAAFKNSKIVAVERYAEGMPGPKGEVMLVRFVLDGMEFFTLNGNEDFPFNEAMSLYVNCESQAEVDELWEKLKADGGEEVCCGWLKDKFGVRWQVIPRYLTEKLSEPDEAKRTRVMQAMMKMVKIDIAKLKEAAGE